MKKLRQWAYVKTCVERLNAVIEDRGKLVIQFKDEERSRVLGGPLPGERAIHVSVVRA